MTVFGQVFLLGDIDYCGQQMLFDMVFLQMMPLNTFITNI